MTDEELHIPDPNDTFVRNLFEEAKTRAIDYGIQSYDEWIDLVEDLIQGKLELGELTKHEDLTTLQQDIERLWPEVEEVLQ